MPTKNAALARWVDEVAQLTTPDQIQWCDGSEAEFQQLLAKMLADGTLEKLNEKTHPNCYLHRSHPSDVARVEHLTFALSACDVLVVDKASSTYANALPNGDFETFTNNGGVLLALCQFSAFSYLYSATLEIRLPAGNTSRPV